MTQLPPPPKLKTTIIQLNKDIDPEDNNYEVLFNEYSSDHCKPSPSFTAISSEEQPRKKRRRSSSLIGSDELARRRTETKQLHSLIEKRRRIKINREFEALRYLIPACRMVESGSKKVPVQSSNGNKIDGMYKLTILKTSVEYILYLHHIIQRQHKLLSESSDDYSYDISFSEIPLNVNQYRNIDQEFNFHDLLTPTPANGEPKSKINATSKIQTVDNDRTSIERDQLNEAPNSSRSEIITWNSLGEETRDQLPTPSITPEISPILTMLTKYKSDTRGMQRSSSLGQSLTKLTSQIAKEQTSSENSEISESFSFSSERPHTGSVSSSTSPFTIPIKSSIKKNSFTLPDPALTSGSNCEGRVFESSSEAVNDPLPNLPRKMRFKTQIPSNNSIANVGVLSDEAEQVLSEINSLEDASKTLLTFRKPSIERLLN